MTIFRRKFLALGHWPAEIRGPCQVELIAFGDVLTNFKRRVRLSQSKKQRFVLANAVWYCELTR